MKNSILNLVDNIKPYRLFGPIMTKELIVSSRRVRNYIVRFLYIVLFALFAVFMFGTANIFRLSNPSVIQISQMAQIGIAITRTMLWFQFLVVQILAMIMLSTAISDEIYNKTLGVLMTTPITKFQIVFGKLFSKLLQLLLLVSISFPVLAIIRVFGGVTWHFVFASICITLTTAIFAGSLSLFFSINNRTLQSVVSKVIVVYFLLYALPYLLYSILKEADYDHIAEYIPAFGLFFINPFRHMQEMTVFMSSPFAPGGVELWIWHCITMIGLSVVVLIAAGIFVRKVGLRQITGPGGLLLTRKERKIADKKMRIEYSSKPISGKIRDIKYPPIIWREIANPLIKVNHIRSLINAGLVITVLIVTYGLCIYFKAITLPEFQIAFILMYIFFALIHSSSYASTSITSEKEARSWPILLTTPMASRDIALQKIVGSLVRAWPSWLFLSLHLVVFILLGKLSVFVLIPLVIVVFSSALLVSSFGVMFSSICKKNSNASSLNIIIFLLFVVPVCCPPIFMASPLLATFVVITHWAGLSGLGNLYDAPEQGIWLLIFSRYSFLVYVFVYLFLSYIAYFVSVDNVRRRIFK